MFSSAPESIRQFNCSVRSFQRPILFWLSILSCWPFNTCVYRQTKQGQTNPSQSANPAQTTCFDLHILSRYTGRSDLPSTWQYWAANWAICPSNQSCNPFTGGCGWPLGLFTRRRQASWQHCLYVYVYVSCLLPCRTVWACPAASGLSTTKLPSQHTQQI